LTDNNVAIVRNAYQIAAERKDLEAWIDAFTTTAQLSQTGKQMDAPVATCSNMKTAKSSASIATRKGQSSSLSSES
jgi:hypothetical protein